MALPKKVKKNKPLIARVNLTPEVFRKYVPHNNRLGIKQMQKLDVVKVVRPEEYQPNKPLMKPAAKKPATSKKQAKIVKKIVKTKARVAKRAAKPARPTRAENLKKRGIKAAAKSVYKMKKAATSKNQAKRTTRVLKQGMKKQAKIAKKIIKTDVRGKKREAMRKLK